MDTQNPRAGQGAGAENVYDCGLLSLRQNRPKIQANPAMRRRLSELLWAFPLMPEKQRRAA